jgi:hypothetical protein
LMCLPRKNAILQCPCAMAQGRFSLSECLPELGGAENA